MNIHEYQAKELLRKYGVFTPRGYPCFDVEEAAKAARRLGRVIIKPQIHSGADTVVADSYFAASREEARALAADILAAPANAAGKKIKRLLVEEAIVGENKFQLLVARMSDGWLRLTVRQLVIGSCMPGKTIHEELVDGATGLSDAQAEAFLQKLDLPESARCQARSMLAGVCAMAIERGAEKIEINPVILTNGDAVLAGGVHACFSEESLITHPEIGAMRDPDEVTAMAMAAA